MKTERSLGLAFGVEFADAHATRICFNKKIRIFRYAETTIYSPSLSFYDLFQWEIVGKNRDYGGERKRHIHFFLRASLLANKLIN